VDLNKLSPAEKIIAGSGVALLIISFLPWFGLRSYSVNGWNNPLSSLAVIVGILMVVQIAFARFTSVTLPKLPVTWGRAHLILGVVAFALVVLQFIVGDKISASGLTGLGIRLSVDLDRKFGLFLGLIASAGLAYGGYQRSREPEATGFTL
jgi:hypothetical protein